MAKKNDLLSIELSKSLNLLNPSSGLSKKQEGILLEYAFLLSSIIEKLTTTPVYQGSLSQKDQKLFHELVNWMEELETAEKYLSREDRRYMLQPDWVELMATVRETNEFDLSHGIKNALEISRGIVENEGINIGSQKRIDDFAILLRKLLSGIMAKLSQGDESANSINLF